MSRKIDLPSSNIQTLDQNTLAQIYNDIANILHNPSLATDKEETTLLEIEFLGKSHILPEGTNLLIEGNSVAIPKSKLVLGFLYAKKVFLRLQEEVRKQKKEVRKEEENVGGSYDDEVQKATAVILLMDPEYLSAANARKRVLFRYERAAENSGNSSLFYEKALRRELKFVDGYLTSRLHRHTKSPTLWSHRRWLLQRFEAAGLKVDVHQGLDIVLVAAERHARNYYSWLHLRWLVTLKQKQQRCKGIGSPKAHKGESESKVENEDKGEREDEEEEKENRILEKVLAWCLLHPSDTSGFSFLRFYAGYLDDRRQGMHASVSQIVLKRTLERTEAFSWVNESVWVFLRTLAASSPSSSSTSSASYPSSSVDNRVVFEELNAKLQMDSTRKRDDVNIDRDRVQVLKTALQWYEKHRQDRHQQSKT